MFHKGKIEKALKPSQRKSITEFASHFGSGLSYEEKRRNKRILSAVLAVLGILLLICIGYFVTDVFIKITEMPTNAAASANEAVKWTLFPIIRD